MKKPALIGTLVGLAMAGFAVQGGEYSTLDLWRLKRQARREQEAIVRLRLEVDSLTRVQRAGAAISGHPRFGAPPKSDDFLGRRDGFAQRP